MARFQQNYPLVHVQILSISTQPPLQDSRGQRLPVVCQLTRWLNRNPSSSMTLPEGLNQPFLSFSSSGTSYWPRGWLTPPKNSQPTRHRAQCYCLRQVRTTLGKGWALSRLPILCWDGSLFCAGKANLVMRIHGYLQRYGLINYGVISRINPMHGKCLSLVHNHCWS